MAFLELHWDRPGPALDAARGELRRALLSAGRPPYWDEWRQSDPLRPPHLRRLTGRVLVVNGQPVWHEGEPVPTDLPVRIERAAARSFQPRRREPLARRLRFSLLPALGLVLLPKCPLCWAAYTGIVTGGGLATWVPQPRTLAVTLAVVLAASLAAVTLRTRRTSDRRPIALAALGAGSVFLGRFALGSAVLTATGFVALAAAAGWAARAQKRRLTPADSPEVSPVLRPSRVSKPHRETPKRSESRA